MAVPSTAWFVGDGSLLVQCAEGFAKAGHRVLGVASSDPAIRRESERRGLRSVPLSDARPRLTDPDRFDYVFSVFTGGLPDEPIRAVPRVLAANFHDGPLPRYAGRHAPVWALLNDDRRYGVTWHEMTSGRDAERILKHRFFDVPDGETAFSLNARCYEAGLQAFAELVDDISHGSVSFAAQDLTQRTEFTAFDRPPGACIVSWDDSAEKIRTMVLALDFGPYTNPFGAARLLTQSGVYLLTAVDLEPSSAAAQPGTVVAIRPDAVLVATATAHVAIRGVRRVTGEPVTIPQFVSEARVRTAERLGPIAHRYQEQLDAFKDAATRSETYWVQQLTAFKPVGVPYASDHRAETTPARARLTMAVTDSDLAPHISGDRDRTAVLLSFIGIYLARLSDASASTVAFTEPRLSLCADPSLFADRFPVTVTLDGGSLGDVVSSVRQQRTDGASHGTFFLDVLARYPGLAKFSASGHWGGAVLVVSTDDQNRYEAPSDCALAIVSSPVSSSLVWDFAPEIFSADAVKRMQRQLACVMGALAADPASALATLPLVDHEERERILVEWNATSRARDPRCVHELIEDQTARTPEAIALVCRDRSITYRALNSIANQIARHLRDLGIGPDVPVGIALDRSIEMVATLLGVLKAGGAYVPLDPRYPDERLAFMATDARLMTVIAEDRLAGRFPMCRQVVCPNRDRQILARGGTGNLGPTAAAPNLAYVIYTSGSTGTPKGVMVEHRNVTNFIEAMDERVPGPRPGVWLAVTSISFDISVLELFWTLARGFKVVLHAEEDVEPRTSIPAALDRRLDFSLFYFAADEGSQGKDKYRLLLEGAKYADAHGFSAVWTPERHFHAFGGLYPNPAVTGAAVAAVTSHVQIRAGSCVIPLHHPLRIAEEWSVVDNLSGGRVGVSFASGWQPNDFILRPENYADRKAVMLRDVATVRKLWRGEPVEYDSPGGGTHLVRTLPRPVQEELPVWLTAAGSPETFQAAASIGAGVLTHLLGQTLDDLTGKISIYRSAWRAAGHPGHGHVVLMLHTLVSDSEDFVRAVVRQPLMDYLRTSIELIKPFAESFPTLAVRPAGQSLSAAFASLSEDDLNALVQHAFERYFETSGLFGTPEQGLAMTERLKAMDVDEVACLIDFGVAPDAVLANLPHLDRLRTLANDTPRSADYSIPALIAAHAVTHLQCTPSMARMFLLDTRTRESLGSLRALFVGGEALSPALAAELSRIITGDIWNMYGPTETTVWSTAWKLDRDAGTVSIGKPLANTQVYVLDSRLQPVPVGLPGDLYIGGAGVVRGYWGRPELTAERFRPNPFVMHAGERVYFTGDVVRHRQDGALEFLGRRDHQVKIRGHRIELGEVEAVLGSHPAVREAVVVTHEHGPEDRRLVAYFVARGQHAATSGTLREFLSQKLPSYLIPSPIVHLDEFPLTPNGKIDRNALPAPDRAAAPRALVIPASDLQRTVADVWQEVLRQTPISTEDNFFDLGGDSLLAAQVLNLLRGRLNQPISLTDLFRFPTVRTLSDHLSGSLATLSPLSQSVDRARLRQEALKQRRAARVGSRR